MSATSMRPVDVADGRSLILSWFCNFDQAWPPGLSSIRLFFFFFRFVFNISHGLVVHLTDFVIGPASLSVLTVAAAMFRLGVSWDGCL